MAGVAVLMEVMLGGYGKCEMILRVPIALIQIANISPENEIYLFGAYGA